MADLFLPKGMRIAPALDPQKKAPLPTPRYALLINPFYRKDPHASFGKHVLTPSLALTSVAGATPTHWLIRYWDENLLKGPPPCDPFPAHRTRCWPNRNCPHGKHIQTSGRC